MKVYKVLCRREGLRRTRTVSKQSSSRKDFQSKTYLNETYKTNSDCLRIAA